MTTFTIHEDSPQAQKLLEFLRTLPFVEETSEQSFDEAIAECNGRPASEFFDELDNRIKQRFKHA